jgi:hypothetical protein
LSVAITARGLRDYAAMFDLDDTVLQRATFLDCAAGASAFGAQVRLQGGAVISADPAYRDGADAIRSRVAHSLAGAHSWLTQRHSAINWTFLGSIEAYVRSSELVLDLFVYDLLNNPQHYIAGAMPELPLPDNVVDVALCANLLFAYSEMFTAEQTTAAIVDLVRVARAQVLIHPTCDRSGEPVDYLDTVLDGLTARGLGTEVFTPSASWLANARTLRVIAP